MITHAPFESPPLYLSFGASLPLVVAGRSAASRHTRATWLAGAPKLNFSRHPLALLYATRCHQFVAHLMDVFVDTTFISIFMITVIASAHPPFKIVKSSMPFLIPRAICVDLRCVGLFATFTSTDFAMYSGAPAFHTSSSSSPKPCSPLSSSSG